MFCHAFFADPKDRLSVQQVMQQPWYREGLSPGVAGYNLSVIAQAQEQAGADDPVSSTDF